MEPAFYRKSSRLWLTLWSLLIHSRRSDCEKPIVSSQVHSLSVPRTVADIFCYATEDWSREKESASKTARRRKKLWKVSVRNAVNLAVTEVWLALWLQLWMLRAHVCRNEQYRRRIINSPLRHAWLNVISKDRVGTAILLQKYAAIYGGRYMMEWNLNLIVPTGMFGSCLKHLDYRLLLQFYRRVQIMEMVDCERNH